VPDAATPVLAITTIVPATIAMALLIAIGPGLIASRARPAEVLREQ
jgi:ABC-type lipoprotein release transport system permease subunit